MIISIFNVILITFSNCKIIVALFSSMGGNRSSRPTTQPTSGQARFFYLTEKTKTFLEPFYLKKGQATTIGNVF